MRFEDKIRATLLGTVDYNTALALQRSVLADRKTGAIPDTVLLLDHPHVVTLGRRADDSHLVTDRAELVAAGVEVVETDRGGEATYHGPGQLIGYPIVDVRAADLGPVTYVRLLEKTIIEALACFDIEAHSVDGESGVWVGGVPNEKRKPDSNPKGKKIAAIGVRISSGITMHGFALNVSTDLSYFKHIVPCGMPQLPFTSVELETGRSVALEDCAKVLTEMLAENLRRELTWIDASEIATQGMLLS